MTVLFKDDDQIYGQFLHEWVKKEGFVLNAGLESSPKPYAMLHKACCPRIDPRSRPTGPYAKVWSDNAEALVQWAADHIEVEREDCKECNPLTEDHT